MAALTSENADTERAAAALAVAGVILHQIGDGTLMNLGARDGTSGPDLTGAGRWRPGVAFRIGAGFPARTVQIVLDPSDTYTVQILRGRGENRYVERELSDVYAENLGELLIGWHDEVTTGRAR